MSTSPSSTAQQAPAVVELLAKEALGPGVVTCPNPKMALWSHHPRVFVDITHAGGGKCPYCGTLYRLKAGEVLHGGH